MRLIEVLKQATAATESGIENLSNAFFMDRYDLDESGQTYLSFAGEGLHFYDHDKQQVSEYGLSRAWQPGHKTPKELQRSFSYPLSPEFGFATRPMGDFGALISYEAIAERFAADSQSFRADRPQYLNSLSLISCAYPIPAESKEIRWPFLSQNPLHFEEPMWVGGCIDPITGAAYISLYHGLSGALLFSVVHTLPDVVIKGVLIASWVAYVAKALLLVVAIIALALLWPEIVAAAAAAGAASIGGFLFSSAGAGFLGGLLGCIGGVLGPLFDFIKEASEGATQDWKDHYETLKAKADAASEKAKRAQENGDPDAEKDALEEQKETLEEINDALDNPDSGMDEDIRNQLKGFNSAIIDGLEQTLNNW